MFLHKKNTKRKFRTVATTTISPENRTFLDDHKITMAHALAFGCQKLKEKYDKGYDPTPKMEENIQKLQALVQRQAERIAELEAKKEVD